MGNLFSENAADCIMLIALLFCREIRRLSVKCMMSFFENIVFSSLIVYDRRKNRR